MGPESSGGSKPPPIARTSATQRTQERRRALIITGGMFLVAAATAAVVIAGETPASIRSSNPARTAAAMPDVDLRNARITNDSDGKGCWQQIFDNQTGRMVRTPQPCDATVYDSKGAPVPVGTIHRLDAISKSFPGR
jgi:hypothetical protein